MVIRSSEPRARTKRSLLQAIAIITATIAGLIALTGTSASASTTCTARPRSNICLQIDHLNNGNYAVHLSISISVPDPWIIMPPQGDPFSAVMMSGSTPLFAIPETDITASAGVLSADFDVTVLPSQLGGRTVFARITFFDANTGSSQVFDSATLRVPD
jgi:hypothetical protein